MQFSSRPPFNDDPRPWAIRWWDSDPRPRSDHPDFDAPEWFDRENSAEYLPRPEFERSQYNLTNRILAAFREREDVHNIYARRQWRNFLRQGWDQSICQATPEEECHAGKVFERWDEVARNHAIDDLLNLEDDA